MTDKNKIHRNETHSHKIDYSIPGVHDNYYHLVIHDGNTVCLRDVGREHDNDVCVSTEIFELFIKLYKSEKGGDKK